MLGDSLEERSRGRDSGVTQEMDRAGIFFFGDIPGTGSGNLRRVPPSPLPNLWNQRLRSELRNNLWGSIAYQENLHIKELRGHGIRKTGTHGATSTALCPLGLREFAVDRKVGCHTRVWKTAVTSAEACSDFCRTFASGGERCYEK